MYNVYISPRSIYRFIDYNFEQLNQTQTHTTKFAAHKLKIKYSNWVQRSPTKMAHTLTEVSCDFFWNKEHDRSTFSADPRVFSLEDSKLGGESTNERLAQFDSQTLAGNLGLVFWWLQSAGNPAESSFHQTYPKSRAWRTRNSRIPI